MQRSMGHRERVLTSLKHKESDRVPLDFGALHSSSINIEASRRLHDYLGLPQDPSPLRITPWSSLVYPDQALVRHFRSDMVALRPPGGHKLVEKLSDGRFRDEWGVVIRVLPEGRYTLEEVPLPDEPPISAIEAHPWPDPSDRRWVEGLAEATRRLRARADGAIVLELPGRIYRLSERMRGFEAWLMDLAVRADFAGTFMDKALEVQLPIIEAMLREVGDAVDIVYVRDSVGLQDKLAISPSIYRSLVKPRQAKLFSFIRERTEATLAFHSCGAVAPLIGDFGEMGVEVLNPVQVSAQGMDPVWLKREFGDSLAFWGGVDSQRLLPFGTPDEIKREVRRLIDIMAPGGGFILGPTHSFMAEVPPQNICALFEAASEMAS